MYIEGHVWNELEPVGAGVGASGLSAQQMLQAYEDSIEQRKALESQGLGGSAYFELFDVQKEQQGFLTYDRAIAKLPVAQIAELNARIVARAKNYEQATEGFHVESADSAPESQRYANLKKEFKEGLTYRC